MAYAGAQDSMQEESFFEYHLYALSRRTSLANNETKQISLLKREGILYQFSLVKQGMSAEDVAAKMDEWQPGRQARIERQVDAEKTRRRQIEEVEQKRRDDVAKAAADEAAAKEAAKEAAENVASEEAAADEPAAEEVTETPAEGE